MRSRASVATVKRGAQMERVSLSIHIQPHAPRPMQPASAPARTRSSSAAACAAGACASQPPARASGGSCTRHERHASRVTLTSNPSTLRARTQQPSDSSTLQPLPPEGGCSENSRVTTLPKAMALGSSGCCSMTQSRGDASAAAAAPPTTEAAAACEALAAWESDSSPAPSSPLAPLTAAASLAAAASPPRGSCTAAAASESRPLLSSRGRDCGKAAGVAALAKRTERG